MITKEEFRDLWRDDELEEVSEKIDDSWRHGNNYWTVYKMPDGTYIEASYRVSGDGEYHGIRDKDFEIRQVFPRIVTVTKLVFGATPPKENDS